MSKNRSKVRISITCSPGRKFFVFHTMPILRQLLLTFAYSVEYVQISASYVSPLHLALVNGRKIPSQRKRTEYVVRDKFFKRVVYGYIRLHQYVSFRDIFFILRALGFAKLWSNSNDLHALEHEEIHRKPGHFVQFLLHKLPISRSP